MGSKRASADWVLRNPEKQRARIKRNRDRLRQRIAEIKLERGCATCGYRGHPDALHFDHLPGNAKEDGIAKMIRNRSFDDIMKEMEKCQVLCANCHAIATAERRRMAERAKEEKNPQLRLRLA